ncbi:hypothetical protein KY290_017112 [Solanum tuberosum]|uniref:Uncharacterized protein n=1 Tax=Solanum tuberosum TaxID=4113 RepID=A0ABQ7VAD7_SOLTU|nr:hypothetical protein KY284_018532 [Solanum tuberosum]KAH0689026.1 hypothetical protein KY289_016384 [Solanum tuberosum]KAH0701885.1 hypothetical protein KY285_016163 [Solanum tuberosum]KAH0761039.1 hypothetical protein KY290_017112 [Solanum tuberosum]
MAKGRAGSDRLVDWEMRLPGWRVFLRGLQPWTRSGALASFKMISFLQDMITIIEKLTACLLDLVHLVVLITDKALASGKISQTRLSNNRATTGVPEAPNVTSAWQPTSSTWGRDRALELVEEKVVIPPQGTVGPLLGLQGRSLRKGALVHLQHCRRMLLLG